MYTQTETNQKERACLIIPENYSVITCEVSYGRNCSTLDRACESFGLSLRFRHQHYYEIVVKWKNHSGYWKINEQTNCNTTGMCSGNRPYNRGVCVHRDLFVNILCPVADLQ